MVRLAQGRRAPVCCQRQPPIPGRWKTIDRVLCQEMITEGDRRTAHKGLLARNESSRFDTLVLRARHGMTRRKTFMNVALEPSAIGSYTLTYRGEAEDLDLRDDDSKQASKRWMFSGAVRLILMVLVTTVALG